MSPGASGDWSKSYDKNGRWIGEGREPFDLWWQRVQGEARALGIKDDDIDEGIKYSVSIPGISDVIHLIPRAKISPDEYEFHKYCLAHGTPSPLSDAQLDTLAWKRETFLKIMNSPTPEVAREAGWYLNQIENVGDMMTAAYWGGRGLMWGLAKAGLVSRSPAAKIVGYAMVGKDIADVVNLFRIARSQRAAKKKGALKGGSMNPFSKEMKASRGFKMQAHVPGIPDWIEIAQVTDQFFGVGISFGSVVGFVSDAIYGVRRGADWKIDLPQQKDDLQMCLEGFAGGCGLQLGP